MLKIRHILFIALLGMPLHSVASTSVQVSIGINLPVYPQLVVVPGYPVYYAPQEDANFFFYDGMYWVYQDDNWYESSWYNGPWWLMYPEDVPVFVLRIPVRYYRQPPMYFRGWQSDEPPRWGEHWGRDWEQRRSGWDRWDRNIVPAPAPLPVYQRQYSGDRYPQQINQQHQLQKQHYRYQPRDPAVRKHFLEQTKQRPARQNGPILERAQSPRSSGNDARGSILNAPQQRQPQINDQRLSPRPAPDQRRQRTPESQGAQQEEQGKHAKRKPKQEQEQERDQGRDRDRNE